MTSLPRSVFMAAIAACCAAAVHSQQASPAPTPIAIAANSPPVSNVNVMKGPALSSTGVVRLPVNTSRAQQSWFLRHYSIGTFSSPLGFGGRIAVSLAQGLNLRAGASYFTYGLAESADNIPFSANIRLQSEQASLDWY